MVKNTIKTMFFVITATILPCNISSGAAMVNKYGMEICPYSRKAEVVKFLALKKGLNYKLDDILSISKLKGYYIDQDYTYISHSAQCEGAKRFLGTKQTSIEAGWSRDRKTAYRFVVISDENGYVRYIEARYFYVSI